MHRVSFGHYLLIILKIEPHYQHHNASERCYQTVKNLTNTIIDCTYDPAYMLLLSLMYVLFTLNHTHAAGSNGIPITKATSSTADISP